MWSGEKWKVGSAPVKVVLLSVRPGKERDLLPSIREALLGMYGSEEEAQRSSAYLGHLSSED